MMESFTRRDFLKLAGIGGVVASTGLGLAGCDSSSLAKGQSVEEFYFAQLSDLHWGFNKKKVNADPRGTLPKAIRTLNSIGHKPDFVVFTGDITHTTDSKKERKRRMREAKSIISDTEVKAIRFLPGEHDASLDRGDAFQEIFGKLHYTFNHKGIHFIVLDNVSNPRGILGDDQLTWLKNHLKALDRNTVITVLTHRPLFPLYPKWGWTTGDGLEALALLKLFKQVTVFYGHIHQEHHHKTGHIVHHSAMSLIFPHRKAGSVPKKKPYLWNPDKPYRGLAVREIEVSKNGRFDLTEHSIRRA